MIADVSIVTLALPQLLTQLHTSVEGVAAVLGLYTLVLAAALALVATLGARVPPRTLASLGFAIFAVGALVCASADSLSTLLVGRAVQGLGGAGALAASFTLLEGAGGGRRTWLWAAILASAGGPAVGGALTQAFDWRAIFAVQVPVAALAAVVSLTRARGVPGGPSHGARAQTFSLLTREGWRLRYALVLLSGALSAVLFLLVLLLVAGWGVAPLRAAVTVSALPIAAALGSRVRRDDHAKAFLGCIVVAGGVTALAWVPQARLWWTVPSQLMAGLGMGMALPALAGGLLAERTTSQAAGLLSLRHIGVAVVLAALGPLIASQLSSATHDAKLQGIGVVLNASLAPVKKLELAPELLGSVDASQPRSSLRRALSSQRSRFPAGERKAFDQLASSADATLLAAIGKAFRDAFLLTGGLALIAAALLLPVRSASLALMVATGVVALAAPLACAYEYRRLAPVAAAVANACQGGPVLGGSGLEGAFQDAAVRLLDRDACRLHISREELILVTGNPAEGRRFARSHHGIEAGSLSGILEGLLL